MYFVSGVNIWKVAEENPNDTEANLQIQFFLLKLPWSNNGQKYCPSDFSPSSQLAFKYFFQGRGFDSSKKVFLSATYLNEPVIKCVV